MFRSKEKNLLGACLPTPDRRKEHWVRDFVNYLYLPPDGKIDPRPLGYWSVYREEGRLCGIIVAIQLFTPQILIERSLCPISYARNWY